MPRRRSRAAAPCGNTGWLRRSCARARKQLGGGASSLDILDLAIANGAEDVHWVYRSVRWFQPTARTKQGMWPNLRELAVIQTVLMSPDRVNRFTRQLLRLQFKWHGLTEIEPDEPFDFAKHQLIPGRRRMIGRSTPSPGTRPVSVPSRVMTWCSTTESDWEPTCSWGGPGTG
jgi:hypothetical protein